MDSERTPISETPADPIALPPPLQSDVNEEENKERAAKEDKSDKDDVASQDAKTELEAMDTKLTVADPVVKGAGDGEFKQPLPDPDKREHGSADCKEKIIEVVREIHQSAKETGGIDPKCFENDNTRYVFKGTEEELCNLIREVVFEDEETRAYAEKTDKMLKQWDESLTREEGMA